jgi:signal transduction histidine kinase
MISTVLRNLFSNSIKFTQPGGQIEVSSCAKGDFYEFCISDNGIGIDKDTLNGLFDLSSKVQRKGTSQETGTGLGLILCKEFVEKNRGKISVESQPDNGSKFCFTIPVSKD